MDLLMYILAPVVLLLSGFYGSRSYGNKLENPMLPKNTQIQETLRGLSAEQFTIVTYPLVTLFILIGAILLMSSSDLISMFLAIELQSYGLYIFATLYRNSEWSTSAGLTYFLLGAKRFRTSLVLRLQLPNSGDALKLLIPNNIRKIMSGWINYSGMVISQKISEKIMGYRGSKSVISNNITVKEQRVDGSWCSNPLHLRCTLKGFERNYQVRILSNPGLRPLVTSIAVVPRVINLQRFFYRAISNLQPKPNRGLVLNPLWLTGFIDGEGCFHISIYKNKNKVGWAVKIEFEIRLHARDKVLLKEIQNYFQVGNIFINSREGISFRIQSPKDLAKIVEFLDLYPLRTQKFSDYVLFKEALNLILNKQHLTLSGLHKIVAIKAKMNLGLSESLQAAFQDVLPMSRPLVNKPSICPEWIAGFASAEGCFFVNIFKSPTHKLKEGVQLEFSLTQHYRDELLMKSLIEFFNCGNVQRSNDACKYRVGNFNDMTENIIPLFKKYPILGEKSKDFSDFCKVLEMIKVNKHLTKEGLEQIRIIKAGMNTGRSKSLPATE
jgi:hypothetical protein